MSTTVARFEFRDHELRTLTIEGEPWFVAADLGVALGYSVASAMTRSLDEDEKGVQTLHTPGGDQQMTVISESGMYSAILASRVPQAREFKRWVTHEVLPAIRKTGSYKVERLTPLQLAERLVDAERRVEAAQERNTVLSGQVAQLAPAASAWEELAAADGDYDTRAAAQILCRAGIDTGQNRLRATLRQIGWTDRQNRPYQRHIDCKRLAERVTSWADPQTGDEHISYQLRITPKGLGELRDLLTASRLTVIDGGAS